MRCLWRGVARRPAADLLAVARRPELPAHGRAGHPPRRGGRGRARALAAVGARIDEAVPDLGELPYADEVVYIGGPVQPEAVVVLVELDEPLEGAEPIVGSVVYMPPDARPWTSSVPPRPRLRRLLGLGPGPARGRARGAGLDRRPRPAGRCVRVRPRRALAHRAAAKGQEVRADRDDALRPRAQLSWSPRNVSVGTRVSALAPRGRLRRRPQPVSVE